MGGTRRHRDGASARASMMKQLKIEHLFQEYEEMEYSLDTGESPYVDGMEDLAVYTKAYVAWLVTVNEHPATPEQVDQWYQAKIVPRMVRHAPDITEIVPRVINVFFVKEYKLFFNKHNKKSPVDYVLNVDKIVEEKIVNPPIVFNSIQTFLLNYEIKKLLDKAITIVNEKYDNIVYINTMLNSSCVLNVVNYLGTTYADYSFKYVLLDKEDEFVDAANASKGVLTIKSLFTSSV
jgi:hypothetical protein